MTAIILPKDRASDALKVEWSGGRDNDRPWLEGDLYYPAGCFLEDDQSLRGSYPVLIQSLDADQITKWHLDQDIVFALGLRREGLSWVSPAEDYLEVARMTLNSANEPELLEIRTEHILDYLCARSAGLLITSFHSRRLVFEHRPSLGWMSDNPAEQFETGSWKGFTSEISESGLPEMEIFKIERIDDGLADEVPRLGPPQEVRTETRKFRPEGRTVVLTSGETWKNEWIEPGKTSPRVRGDRSESAISFYVSADGETASGSALASGGLQWLWFRPTLANDLLSRRGGSLIWYTEDTGRLGLASHSPIHFGVNALGLINVLSKDVSDLPEHVQRIWSSHNLTPEGAVSRELLDAQVRVSPAETSAPESRLWRAVGELHESSRAALGEDLLGPAPESELFARIHRFQCARPTGRFLLCKEIHRAVAERFDLELLKRLAPSPEDKKMGPIKRLAEWITSRGENGRAITAPLVGVNELRQADAHLPSSDLEGAKSLLGLVNSMNEIAAGKQILSRVAESTEAIGKFFRALKSPWINQ